MKTFDQIAEEMLKIKPGEVRDSLSSCDVSEWDSMNYLLFIAELEKQFHFSFAMDEVMNAKCLGDLRKIVEARKQ